VTGCTDVDSNGDSLRRAFAPFGRIVDIRREIDKGTAFVKYDTKESACQAIVALNMGTYIGGQNIKCSWSKITDKVNPEDGPAHLQIQSQPQQETHNPRSCREVKSKSKKKKRKSETESTSNNNNLQSSRRRKRRNHSSSDAGDDDSLNVDMEASLLSRKKSPDSRRRGSKKRKLSSSLECSRAAMEERWNSSRKLMKKEKQIRELLDEKLMLTQENEKLQSKVEYFQQKVLAEDQAGKLNSEDKAKCARYIKKESQDPAANVTNQREVPSEEKGAMYEKINELKSSLENKVKDYETLKDQLIENQIFEDEKSLKLNLMAGKLAKSEICVEVLTKLRKEMQSTIAEMKKINSKMEEKEKWNNVTINQLTSQNKQIIELNEELRRQITVKEQQIQRFQQEYQQREINLLQDIEALSREKDENLATRNSLLKQLDLKSKDTLVLEKTIKDLEDLVLQVHQNGKTKDNLISSLSQKYEAISDFLSEQEKATEDLRKKMNVRLHEAEILRVESMQNVNMIKKEHISKS